MFTRQVRLQLVAFGILTIASMLLIALNYLRLPDLAGIGQRHVTFEFADATGLYDGALVTYRGVPVGKVTSIKIGGGDYASVGAQISTQYRIPRDADVFALSTSAVGENYIDLVPPDGAGPYLSDGAVVGSAQTHGLPSTDRLLTNLNALAASIPQKASQTLLSQAALALNDGNHSFDQLIASANSLVDGADRNLKSITSLVTASHPFLQTVNTVAPSIGSSVRDLAGIAEQVNADQANVNAILANTPSTVASIQNVVSDVQSDVPVLLDNLLSTGQVLKVYLPGIEQVLVVYPGVMSAVQSAATDYGAPDSINLGARLTANQPPNCYSGFLPIKNQRPFSDLTPRAYVPPDLYCHAAHNDPRDVRGARNTPCLNNPGVRAASVEECLGYPIGAKIDPLGRTRGAVSYDPSSGIARAPDGQFFQVAGVSSQQQKVQTWQSLFLP